MTQANRAFYSELYKDNTQHQSVDVLLYNLSSLDSYGIDSLPRSRFRIRSRKIAARETRV